VPTALPIVFLAGAALVMVGAARDLSRMLVPALVLALGVLLSMLRPRPT
jgi:hypothetical protein